MEEDIKFGKRLRNCCRIHHNGFFNFLSPLVLLPLVFREPTLEYRTLYLLILSLLWYTVDVIPQGVTAVLPMVLLPIFGVMSSTEVCMSYTQDSQMVFVLACFMAIAMVNNRLDRFLALRLLRTIGVNPMRYDH
ncbi:Na(+)/dicarboxylate cotransporter 3-like [Musca domestica]|uniref:Na(+)/dicarboxylate cotransporter 3-like n=1 Tax=Musca domestica TaxID=7370 RepID=A0ABM3VIB3_MUSDO|nr:Na(+)/dicarboxylate cotransporter 3-like [Musca domestica]